MDDEIDVYRLQTFEGKLFLVTTYRIVLPDDIERQESIVVPMCEVESVEKNNTPFSNTLLLHTHTGDVHKIRFRAKKDVQTLADIITFLIQELKDSLEASLYDTMCQLEIPYPEIIMGNEIGQGAFGTVFKALWNGLPVAVKKIKLQTVDDRRLFQREVAALISLRHPGCVQFYGVSYQEDALTEPFIVMEFCEGQTLFDIIKTNNPVISRWDTLIRLLYDISRCMQFIHTRGVVHRDLKAENIMIYERGIASLREGEEASMVKIVDFGISRFLSREQRELIPRTLRGTPGNFAPEVFTGDYSFSSDVFSFGVVMYQALFQCDPFPNAFSVADYRLLVEQEYEPAMCKPLPPLVEDILKQCLHYDQKQRPPFQDITRFLRNCMLQFQVQRASFSPLTNSAARGSTTLFPKSECLYDPSFRSSSPALFAEADSINNM